MPPKDNADTTATHPLQAVVLADSFTRTFRPMSLEQPKVGLLFPFGQKPSEKTNFPIAGLVPYCEQPND